jgi:hypothetical protein
MVAASRSVPDADLRSLQVRGSARLATYLSRLTHQGVQVAHGLHRVPRGGSAPAPAGAVGAGAAEGSCEERVGTAGSWVPPLPTAVIGTAFSEDADVDDLDDLGRRAGSYRRGAPASHRVLATPRARLAGWLVVVAVLVIGSRGLLGSGLPVIGQFVPFSGWATTWGHVFSGWQTAGTGSGAPSSPAWALLGLAGTAVAGRMGFLQEALVLGCVPVGAWGVSRLLGPFASVRGRFAGVVTYLALPLAYDALARGRWVGLIAYAAVPWIVGHLAKATGLPPFDGAPSQRSLWWRSLALGGVEALAVAFAPATSVVVVVCAAGIALGSSVAGGWHGAWRAVRVAGGATVVTAVAFAPWVAATLASGRSAFVVLGLAGNPHGLPGWGGLLRLDVGPIGGSPLSWLPIAAAAVPLLVARRCRWEWSARLWGVAGVAWIVAVVSAKAWAVPFAPDVDVLLAPAAVALASGAGLAVAAFESDVADFRFGWRQALAAAGVAAVALAAVPVLVGSTGGRWDAPGTGFGQAVAFPVVHRPSDGYRVLWLGDPQVLPAGWPIAPGLAYTMSANGMPAASDLWLPAAPPRTAGVVRGVTEALRGETVDLGRLLAPAHIRFVAVVGALAPQTPGVQTAPVFPVPGGLVAALARQGDLRTVPTSAGGITVFENADRLALQPADVTVAPAGAARPLDAWWAAIELVLWVLVALSLLDVRRRLAHRWTTGQVRRHHVTRRAHRSESPVVLPADAHADGTAPAAEMDPGRASAPHPPSFSAASGPAAPCETLVAPPSGGDGR